MTYTKTRWNGTDDEASLLLGIIKKSCDCQDTFECSMHRLIRTDQRFLDGLLWGRRNAGRYRDEEAGLTGSSCLSTLEDSDVRHFLTHTDPARLPG